MFECNREKFLLFKNISSAPSLEDLQKFYSDNAWRVEPGYDPEAINCYERLYYFWEYYKPKESFPWWAILLFVLVIGKNQ